MLPVDFIVGEGCLTKTILVDEKIYLTATKTKKQKIT